MDIVANGKEQSMADLIDRQAAIDAMMALQAEDDEAYGCRIPEGFDGERAKEVLEQLPSAHPEDIYYVKFSEEDYEKIAEQLRKIPTVLTLSEPEIVRCAECKWFQYNMRFDGHLPKGVDEFECRHWCGSCDPTDFCSYAERKEQDDG